jgi:hypothetical protein
MNRSSRDKISIASSKEISCGRTAATGEEAGIAVVDIGLVSSRCLLTLTSDACMVNKDVSHSGYTFDSPVTAISITTNISTLN